MLALRLSSGLVRCIGHNQAAAVQAFRYNPIRLVAPTQISLKCASPNLLSIQTANYAGRGTTNNFTSSGRTTKGKSVLGRLKESAYKPASGQAIQIGQLSMLAGGIIGLLALCFYGMGMASQEGFVERSAMWPKYVKERVQSTYMYLGGGLGITVASAVSACRSPVIMNMMMRNSMMSFVVTMAAIIGSSIVAQSIPYPQNGIGVKHLAWAAHCAILGAVVAPLSGLGGALVMRAGIYTAGIVGGLSTVATCAPNDKFMNIGGILGMGFGVVLAASIGNIFLHPSTALGSGLYAVSIYGGLLLFSGFLLYDTQKAIRISEGYPLYGINNRPFDPINNSMGIYADVLNIFIRMAMILGGGKRK